MTKEQNYCVYCHTCPNGMQYFGVTKNVKNRWYSYYYRTTSLAPYIEKYGWENIKHEVLAARLTRDVALRIEGVLIANGWNIGNCINSNRSGQSKAML